MVDQVAVDKQCAGTLQSGHKRGGCLHLRWRESVASLSDKLNANAVAIQRAKRKAALLEH
jgi:hypothetical protein